MAQRGDRDQGSQALNDIGITRTGEQYEVDARETDRQRAALGAARGSKRYHAVAQQTVKARRVGVEGAQQFTFVHDRSPGGIAVRRDCLLVRTRLQELDPELWAVLTEALPDATTHVRGAVTRLSSQTVAHGELLALAQHAWDCGQEASLDHIVPLNIICKSEGGPAATVVGDVPGPEPRDGAVVVALIDTGVPDRASANPWQVPLERTDNVDALDAFSLPGVAGGDGFLDASAGHGSFAAGVVQQVDPQGAICMRKAIDSDGVGSEVDVAEELLQAVIDDRAEIVNLSLGTQTIGDRPLLAIEVALEVLDAEGYSDVLVVAAAGNYGERRLVWPAASKRVVAVAALTATGEPAAWSSHGYWVDVSCVGEGIVSTYVRGKEDPQFSQRDAQGVPQPDDWTQADRPWAVWSGTSFAAPQVAAEVARRLTDLRVSAPATTPRQALASLLATGKPVVDYGIALRLLEGTQTPKR